MRLRLRSVAVLVTATLMPWAGLAVLAGLAPSAGAAADDPDCDTVRAETEERTVDGANAANADLHVEEAVALLARRGIGPGEGVRVVVVDSGIAGFDSAGPSPLDHGHGLTVAGIIAGADQVDPDVAVGIAPAATLEDRPFYTAARGSGSDDGILPTSDGLAAVLRGVAADRRAGRLPERTVVVVPTEVGPSPALESAVDRLTGSGVLVVAASGDRPAEDAGFLPSYAGPAEPGEDAAAELWPSADPEVLAVGVSTDGAVATVLRNSAVDVAAPGTDAVSRGLNGGWCRVTSISSHWAAAQVAGVAALVWSGRPDASATEIRERLVTTASGNAFAESPLRGRGVVQPLEALERDSRGTRPAASEEAVRPAEEPRARADVLAPTREQALWWALGGGGGLAVLLLLRPVLARRGRDG